MDLNILLDKIGQDDSNYFRKNTALKERYKKKINSDHDEPPLLCLPCLVKKVIYKTIDPQKDSMIY